MFYLYLNFTFFLIILQIKGKGIDKEIAKARINFPIKLMMWDPPNNLL